MLKAFVITVSDSGAKGERVDLSGPAACEILAANGYEVVGNVIVPDEMATIECALRNAVDDGIELVLTSGGTGFSERDVTPEATLAVIEKNAYGIAEAIRAESMRYTQRAMLSRGVAGICARTLIINLPGSPKAVKESLEYILPSVKHGLEILLGLTGNCAR